VNRRAIPHAQQLVRQLAREHAQEAEDPRGDEDLLGHLQEQAPLHGNAADAGDVGGTA
jgi:hypothetical protein